MTMLKKNSLPEFGDPMKAEFALAFDKDIAFCNHGSYGAVPKKVLQKRLDLLTEVESHPDQFFRGKARDMYNSNLKRVADFLGSSPENVVFLSNPTTAINTVMNSLSLTVDDGILCNTHTYPAILNTIDFSARKWNAQVHTIELKLPIMSEQQVVNLFVEACQKNKNIKIAIIDHISSCSAIKFPVKKIIEALKSFNILILIDGAHAPGQIPNLDLDNLGADFYTGTLHKWCYATKGSAILWVDPKHHGWCLPLVKSFGYQLNFQDEFFFQGTGDLTRYLVNEAALDFYDALGGQSAIAAHAEKMLDFAEDLFCKSFGLKPSPIPKNLQAPYLRLIEMPTSAASKILPVMDRLTVDALTKRLCLEAKIVVNLSFFGDKAWMRLSANVYNSQEDYVKLKDRLTQFFQNPKNAATVL